MEYNSNYDYVKNFARLYNDVKSRCNPDDFNINEEQMNKLYEVCAFLKDMTDEDLDGEITEILLSPTDVGGGVTATFCVFSVYKETLEEFLRVMSYISAITISATTDSKVCISVTVPGVFEFKE